MNTGNSNSASAAAAAAAAALSLSRQTAPMCPVKPNCVTAGAAHRWPYVFQHTQLSSAELRSINTDGLASSSSSSRQQSPREGSWEMS